MITWLCNNINFCNCVNYTRRTSCITVRKDFSIVCCSNKIIKYISCFHFFSLPFGFLFFFTEATLGDNLIVICTILYFVIVGKLYLHLPSPISESGSQRRHLSALSNLSRKAAPLEMYLEYLFLS